MQNNRLTTIRLDSITPADYNPRLLSDEAAERLKESLTKLGIVKAIIVNGDNGVIVAGHQRTKTMRSIGIEECPAFRIHKVSKQDEVRFNQFHNRCEYEFSSDAPRVVVTSEIKPGWNLVPNRDILIEDKGKRAGENNILADLLIKYGTFGNSICTMDGNVFVSAGYALATKLCGLDLYVYAVDDEQAKLCRYYFSKDYGKYSYDNIKRETFVQGLAQLHRLPADGKVKRSSLYTNRIIPALGTKLKGLSMLDFGAGKFDYAKLLQSKGVDIDCIDPYHCLRTGVIDAKGNRQRFLDICDRLRNKGLYDVVICDSVLNSVDTPEARKSVILTCFALVKVGGFLYISGRMEPKVEKNSTGLRKQRRKTMYFLDDDGFTASMCDGHWFFQKFDTDDQIRDICKLLGKGQIFKEGSSWQIEATKEDRPELLDDIIKALRFEWDMPLPVGRYGLSDEIENAYRYAISNH